jgi:hypothetical protein
MPPQNFMPLPSGRPPPEGGPDDQPAYAPYRDEIASEE